MGRMSNNNKMSINNLSRCFAIRVVYIRITVKWGIWYIDEGFLIWIIPSMYLSHEVVTWVVLLVLSYLLSSSFYSNFQFFYYIIILYIPGSTTYLLLYWSPAIIILYTDCLMPYITLELLYLTSWLVYSWFMWIFVTI